MKVTLFATFVALLLAGCGGGDEDPLIIYCEALYGGNK
jgi:hypothetical protein